jgi:hypothetical protein
MSDTPFDNLSLSVTQSTTIQSLIDDYPGSLPESFHHHARYAKHYNALPLSIHWMEITAIDAKGDVFMWSDEGQFDGLRPIQETKILHQSLVDGAKRHPELSFLIPARPMHAADCDCCGGTGVFPVPRYEAVVCKCGGVGWLAVDGQQERQITSVWPFKSSSPYR